MEQIDEGLYSRQLLVLGARAMASMAGARVFLSGLGGLGVEIAKNIVLGGVRSFTCHDTAVCREDELNFFVTAADVGRNRAEVSCPLLADLNPYVKLDWSSEPLTAACLEAVLGSFSLVILTETPLRLCCEVDAFCRGRGIKFIAAAVMGVFSWSFVDVGSQHEVHDVNGEAVADIKVAQVAASEGEYLVKTLEAEPHDLQEGDIVALGGGQARVVKVVKSDQFVIDKLPGDSLRVTEFVKMKQVVEVAHMSMAESMAAKPKVVGSDFSKSASAGSLFLALLAVDEFRQQNDSLPRAWNAEDAADVVVRARRRLPFAIEDSLFGEISVDELDVALVQAVASTAAGCLHPLCAFLGGAVAQEAQKAISGKFMPQNQWALFDAREVLASQSPAFDAAAFRPAARPSRSEALRICCGDAAVQQLSNTSLFMVGVGAIGCELMKNFAMLGVATVEDAVVRITDPDLIEKSNLNRQFLFRPSDISQPKSSTAARVIARMNPEMHVVATLDKVGPETESKYSDAFFDKIDVVVNALDNVQARQYVDSRCVALGKPLLESGTLGTKGHVQVILPHLTTSYTDNRDPPGKDIPFCTLKSFPNKIEHTLEWSKDLAFEKQFVQKPAELNRILQQGATVVSTLLEHPQGSSFAKTVKRAIRMLHARPASFADCVAVARHKFEHYFANAPKQLLHLFPPNHTVKDGGADVPFWTPPKVAPVPVVFDAGNGLHASFVLAFASLYGFMWGIPPSLDAAEAARVATTVAVPRFVPREGKVVETDPSKKQPDQAAAAAAASTSVIEFEGLCKSLDGLLKSVPQELQLRVIEFEKDVDSNFHVDFVAACANLRAANYGIKAVGRLEAKRIAGRIIPAIATTTSVVSAHVALELLKITSKALLGEHRNLNTNLALPFYLFSTPDEAVKKHIGDVAFTKWDNWDVKTLGLDATVQNLMDHFREEYGLEVQSVCHGASIVYHEDFAFETHETLRELLQDIPKASKFVPLTVMFHGTGDEVCSGPAVRFFLKKTTKKRRK